MIPRQPDTFDSVHGGQNVEPLFERMRKERARMAEQYRSQGKEEGLKIRAEADKKRRLGEEGAKPKRMRFKPIH